MNWDTIKGKWSEVGGEVKAKWAKLTDDDIKVIGGKFESLVGRLQQLYGYEKEKAETEVDSWLKSIPTKPKA